MEVTSIVASWFGPFRNRATIILFNYLRIKKEKFRIIFKYLLDEKYYHNGCFIRIWKFVKCDSTTQSKVLPHVKPKLFTIIVLNTECRLLHSFKRCDR